MPKNGARLLLQIKHLSEIFYIYCVGARLSAIRRLRSPMPDGIRRSAACGRGYLRYAAWRAPMPDGIRRVKPRASTACTPWVMNTAASSRLLAKISHRDFLKKPDCPKSANEIFSKAQNVWIHPTRFSRKLKTPEVSKRDFLESRKRPKSAIEIFSKGQNGQSQPSRFSRKAYRA